MPTDQKFSQPNLVLPVAKTQQDPNWQQSQQQQVLYKSWGVRVYQSVAQAITNNTTPQVGYDTLSYNTFQAVAQAKYNLRFISQTLSTHVYPYTQIVLPLSGYYYVHMTTTMSMGSAAGTEILLAAYIRQNGTTILEHVIHGHTSGIISPLVSVSVDDVYHFQAGDVVDTAFLQGDATGATNSTGPGSPATWFTIRYHAPG